MFSYFCLLQGKAFRKNGERLSFLSLRRSFNQFCSSEGKLCCLKQKWTLGSLPNTLQSNLQVNCKADSTTNTTPKKSITGSDVEIAVKSKTQDCK